MPHLVCSAIVTVAVASRLLAFFSVAVAVMFQNGLRADTLGACSTMSSVAVASRYPYPNYSESGLSFPTPNVKG